jgi:hypothetical protein
MSQGGSGASQPRQHAGYQCLGCKHVWTSITSLQQHQGSPFMRGTTCGSLYSAAELRTMPRAHLVTGLVQAVPVYCPGSDAHRAYSPLLLHYHIVVILHHYYIISTHYYIVNTLLLDNYYVLLHGGSESP